MTGALIPDDWDGETFICQKVRWPASPQWRAILLGQVSEPNRASYWDEETGDVEEAQEGVDEAFALTIPEIWEKDCEDVPNFPIVAFKAKITVRHFVLASTWSTITWDALAYEYNDPEYDLSDDGHLITEVKNQGVWHYDVNVLIDTTPSSLQVRARFTDTSQNIARTNVNSNFLNMGFDYDWPAIDRTLDIQLWASEDVWIEVNPGHTFFSGHYVGPVTG